ncbi:lipopolysaccharide biosynthesis protein [Pedobacter sp. KACC 23697]|uniref:Oligosaccharide flippase family protein n=1 Tax=Pedobacter sp. KACC 23697 TaxID=3149230 RepID=A0AAU7K3D8_9SPHI
MINRIKLLLGKGDERQGTANINIVVSFFLKGASVATSLIVVPLTIDFVSPIQYGIWLTLGSIIGWMNFFDIGFSNGLKNKLTAAVTKKDMAEAKILISTSYAFIAFISIILFVIFFVANQFLDWTEILNTDKSFFDELRLVTTIVFAIFSIQFVLQLLNTICIACHDVRLSGLISFLGNLLGLGIVLVLLKVVKGSLLALSLSIGIAPLIVLLLFTIILFNTRYRQMSPSINKIDKLKGKEIIGLSSKFFIIQIGLLFFYNIDNVIISQVAGPLAVTSYGIAFKYFSVITMISGIVMTPFWPAFTEAHIKNDKAWIIKTINKLQRACILIFILSFFMLLVSKFAYKFWVGKDIAIPFMLSAILSYYVAFNTFRTIFVYYLNATNKLSIQVLIVVGSGFLNIPLGFWLGHLLGASGVILSTAILCTICGIIEIIQYKKLINNHASGIWDR